MAVVISLMGGLAGKVEKGPSCTERLLGGLPRNLPAPLPVVDGHALETTGVCLLLARCGDLLVEEGRADFGSSKAGPAEKLRLGVMADCGYADVGVSVALNRHGMC